MATYNGQVSDLSTVSVKCLSGREDQGIILTLFWWVGRRLQRRVRWGKLGRRGPPYIRFPSQSHDY